MTSKVCYYYQTFKGLDKLLADPSIIDVIIVSSIHFGTNKDSTPYIHLNNLAPTDDAFDTVWKQTKELASNNTEILLMVGGAGGGYQEFFSSYSVCLAMLIDLIKTHNWISGIDLDIEEEVSLDNIEMLICDLHVEFGDNFIITMAPLSSSLMFDDQGMGGFSYKDLYRSCAGEFITRFHVQAYGEYSFKTFDAMVNNGYPAKKLILGMLSGQFNTETFKDALTEVGKIKAKYNDAGGVFDWEYFDAPPNDKDPGEWARLMTQRLKFDIVHRMLNYFKSFM